MFATKNLLTSQEARLTGAVQRSIQAVKLWVDQAQNTLETVERDVLDPLLDRALESWGDQRQRQRQLLNGEVAVSVLTADERQINRGLYIALGSLGLALFGTLIFPPLRLLSLPGLVYGSWHSYERAYQALTQKRKVGINLLTALVNTAYIASGYLILGNLTTTSYFASLKLLSVVKGRFEQDLRNALAKQPQSVWLLVEGIEVKLHLAQLQLGDLVVVHVGEVIAVDGLIIEGAATVDQHVLTGEAQPVEKSVGDRVLAATLLLTGKLVIRVEQTSTETTVAKISEILAQTVDFRSTRELNVQRVTDWLVLPFLGLSAVTWPWLGFSSAAAVIDAHPHRQLNVFGALGLLNYLVLATEQGILVKDGRSLELLSKIDTLVFDKTGTLTQEQPQLVAIHLWDTPTAFEQAAEPSPAAFEQAAKPYTEDEVLAYVAAAEQYQSHPIARAILAEARARGLVLPAIDHAGYRVGYGLAVEVAGHILHIGSARFMQQEAIAIPPGIAQLQETGQRQGHSFVLVAIDGQLVSVLELQAALRPEARAIIADLRQRAHIQSIIIVSGDQLAPTRRLAQELDADEYFAEVLPAGKAALIAQWQAAGRRVCFVGDGINDAVALKQANVSISLRGATTAATDTAHIVLMDESLQQMIPLFDLAQKFDVTTRNTFLAILTPGAVGLAGIFCLHFGLVQMTVLDQIGLTMGMGIAMRPRLWKGHAQAQIVAIPANQDSASQPAT